MPKFAVERQLTGITQDQLAGAQRAAIDTARWFSSNGKDVRYIRSMFFPGDARCICMFEAANADIVRQVNEAAKLPFSNISEALDLVP